MATNMLSKFEKYWSNFSIILAIAVILDPRYKFNFIEWCYKKLYGGDYLTHALEVKEKLFSLFMNYSKGDLHGSISSASTSTMTQSSQSQSENTKSFTATLIKSQFLQDFETFEDDNIMPKKSELEIYLDEPRLDSKLELNILHYWKSNQFRFPEVAAMARDVLCIPISTVASESAFSNSGRILDQYRSALKHDIVEALVCIKDWLYGDQDTLDYELEQITDNIMKVNVNESESVGGEISVNASN